MKHLSPLAFLLLACSAVSPGEKEAVAVCQEIFACLENCDAPDCYSCREGLLDYDGRRYANDLHLCHVLYCSDAADPVECRATHCAEYVEQCNVPGAELDRTVGVSRCYDLRLDLEDCTDTACEADAIFGASNTARNVYWSWVLYAYQECGGCAPGDTACIRCWNDTDNRFPVCFPESSPLPSDDCSGFSGVAFCLCATNYDYSACQGY